MRSDFKNILGHRFGKLTVIELVTSKGTKNHMWHCRCDCGGSAVVQGGALGSGLSNSCGCLQIQVATKHGMERTLTYNCWGQMKSRCLNPRHKSYPDYGGRGIGVCQRWLDFINFYADMGEKPEGASLDRIDNNSGYSPENCRWADAKTQGNNKRNNRMLTIGDRTQTLKQWSLESSISEYTIRSRIRMGWEPIKAITIPSDKRRSTKRKRINSSE